MKGLAPPQRTCVGSFVYFEVLGARKHLSAAWEGTRERLLSRVHSNVVHKFVLGLERAPIPGAVLPEAGVGGALGTPHVLHRQVGDDFVHAGEGLVAGLLRVGLVLVYPQARQLLLYGLTHVPEEGPWGVGSHRIHVHVVHAVVELGAHLLVRPLHARQTIHIVHVPMVGIVKAWKHHRGGIVPDGAEHGVVLVVGEVVGAQRAQRGHVLPAQEEVPGVGAHVAVVHRVVHPITVVVLIPLCMGDGVGAHMVGRRTQLVPHERAHVAPVHEGVEHGRGIGGAPLAHADDEEPHRTACKAHPGERLTEALHGRCFGAGWPVAAPPIHHRELSGKPLRPAGRPVPPMASSAGPDHPLGDWPPWPLPRLSHSSAQLPVQPLYRSPYRRPPGLRRGANRGSSEAQAGVILGRPGEVLARINSP